MLILKSVELAPIHGWGVAERIEHSAESVLQLGRRRFTDEFAQWQRMSRVVNLVLEATSTKS